MDCRTGHRAAANGHQSQYTLPVVQNLFIQATASAIALYPLAVWFEDLQVQWTRQFVFAIAWFVVVLSIGAYGLMLKRRC